MTRRRKSRGPLSLAVLVAVLLIGAVGWVLPSLLNPSHNKPRLNLMTYIENPTAFAGNTYYLEGDVNERLARQATGAAYAITTAERLPVAVIVPTETTPPFNIEKGQSLCMDVRIADNGAAIVTAVSKK